MTKKLLRTLERKGLTRIIKTTLIAGFFLFIAIYAFASTRFLTEGVDLSVLGIETGRIYREATLELAGNAKRAKHLLVNGREISINQEGEFSDVLVLLPGYNIIVVSAEDKFGKVTEEVFEVVHDEL